MDAEKIGNVKKVKRALIEKQNIIRGKFQSVLKTRLGTERKLDKKYKPIITEIKKLQPKKEPTNQRNAGRNGQDVENLPEDVSMGDSSDETDIEDNDELLFDDYFPTSGTSQQQQPSIHESVLTDDNSDFGSVIETNDDYNDSNPIRRAIKREPVSDFDEFDDDDVEAEYENYANKKSRESKKLSKKNQNDQRRVALEYRNRKLDVMKKKFFKKPFPAFKRRGSPETVQNIQKNLKLDEADHARLLEKTRPIVDRKKKALEQIKMVRNAHPPIQPESHDLGRERSPLVQQIQQSMPTLADGSNLDLPRSLDPLLFSKSITRQRTARRPPKQQAYIHNPLRKRSRQVQPLNSRKLQRFNASDYLANIRRFRRKEISRADMHDSSDSETDERSKKSKKGGQKSGKGLQNEFVKYGDRVVYEYYDDPNELCDRLKLLVSSKQAGNTNHDYEINSIVEELREAGIIH